MIERRSRERCGHRETRQINRGLIDELNGTFKDTLIIAVKPKHETAINGNTMIVDDLNRFTVLLRLIKTFLHLLECRR